MDCQFKPIVQRKLNIPMGQS